MENNQKIKQPVKKTCEYCGNNPVPHFVFWYFESFNILLTPIRQWLLKIVSFARLPNFSRPALFLGKTFGIISFNEDINKCKVERAKVLWQEAIRRGIKMKELLLFGKPFDVYEAVFKIPNSKFQIPNKFQNHNLKNFNIVFSGLPRPKIIDRAALDAMDDKAILKKKFLAAGLPVPKGGSVWNFSRAKKIFNQIEKPVIVKPRAGSRGRHSTTFIFSVDDLQKAYNIAKKLCFWAVVEEQLFGPVYRATVINYQLSGVLRGDSPQVLGDGENNIAKLIETKNLKPHPGVKDIRSSVDTEKFLARQNFKLTSVPKNGEIVYLSEKIGVNYGGSSSEDFKICHPDNKELFVLAAKIVNDPIIGFDFIIPDISKSWKKQKCGFIEANSLPFINLHHNPLLGEPRNVAAKVWNMIEQGR